MLGDYAYICKDTQGSACRLLHKSDLESATHDDLHIRTMALYIQCTEQHNTASHLVADVKVGNADLQVANDGVQIRLEPAPVARLTVVRTFLRARLHTEGTPQVRKSSGSESAVFCVLALFDCV